MNASNLPSKSTPVPGYLIGQVAPLSGLLFAACSLILLSGCGQRFAQDKLRSHEQTSASVPKRHAVRLTKVTPQNPSKSNISSATQRPDPGSVILGVDADFSHNSATGGRSILRGVELAVEDINRRGGLLGRPVEIIVRDHHGNPRRGIDNIEMFAELPNTLAVVGGVHTPVAIEELPVIHQHELIYLGPWAAGTPVVTNGYSPNFVFRVSVRDEYAGEFLVDSAVKCGFDRIGMLLEQTGWGKSNEKAIHSALAERGLTPSATAWFDWNHRSFADQLEHLRLAETEAVILVANSPEGAAAVKEMASLPDEDRIPFFSHWGILGGEFQESTQNALKKVDLRFLQTFTFFENDRPEAILLGQQYCDKYGTQETKRISAPFGTAHAYDLVQLLAAAVRNCNSLNRPEVRLALEQLQFHEGVVKQYHQPFSPADHDALDVTDFRLMRFTADGMAVPSKQIVSPLPINATEGRVQ